MTTLAPTRTTSRIRPLAADASGAYSSWGNYPKLPPRTVYQVEWRDQVEPLLSQIAPEEGLPFGFGRSYGDSCLSKNRTLIDCAHLNRFISFNPATGRLACEAGVSLAEIVDFALPQGWFLPVTPGTKFVTVGGAIANDVHGKNHHGAGCFGNYVTRLTLVRSDAGMVECTPRYNADMFGATIGGLGLTGVIVAAELQLKRVAGTRMDVQAIPFTSMDEFVTLSAESDQQFEYTVAWIDCFSKQTRGIFLRGNHREGFAAVKKTKVGAGVPFFMPEMLLNRASMKVFNSAYFYAKKWTGNNSVATTDSFFYPLDAVYKWNRIYGKSGFVQYQCVVPEVAAKQVEYMLRIVANAGLGSFLAILKKFGSVPSPGMMSFPRPGLTLALDFPVRAATLPLLRQLDEVVSACGGALYPAKDARMSPAMFEQSFPHWRRFAEYIDPKMSSSLWRRVTGAGE